MMDHFVVWELRGVKYLCLNEGTPWVETLKRLPA